MSEPIAESSNAHTLKTCEGIVLQDGTKLFSKTVIITTGTFLSGQINIGATIIPAGRIGDAPAIGLANSLKSLEFRLSRLKTGTPPRLRASSIDFSNLECHLGDSPPIPFSFMNSDVWLKSEDQVIVYFIFYLLISMYEYYVLASLLSHIHDSSHK